MLWTTQSKEGRPEKARVRRDECHRVAKEVSPLTSEQRPIGNENVQESETRVFQREQQVQRP